MSVVHAPAGAGRRLVEALGLEVLGVESGHDLKLACIACDSSDACRVHQDRGVGFCHSCDARWSPFQFAVAAGLEPRQAFRMLVELELYEPNKNGAAQPPADLVEQVAVNKRCSAEGLRRMGLKAGKTSKICSAPMYGPDGQECSSWWIPTGDKNAKGKNLKGKSAGVFMMHNADGNPILPKPREKWFLVEGIKDAAALVGLGFNAVGLPGSSLGQKFTALFAGVDVVLVADRDVPGENGAIKSASRLAGVASTLRIARLPSELKPSGGDDVRDILARKDGEAQLRQAMAGARQFDPAIDKPHKREDREGDANTDKQTEPPEDSTPGNIVANAVRMQGGEGPAATVPISICKILERLEKQTGGWPRRVNNLLFVDDSEHGLSVLESVAALFGYLHRRVGKVEWTKGVGCVQRDEIFAELQRTARSHLAIESAPHFPPIRRHYYAHPKTQTGDGKALAQLIDQFCPATELDRELMLCFVATLFWGGPCGARPAFAIVAETGRGKGKTKFVTLTSNLVGGAFDFSLGEKIDAVKKRLLTASAMTKRVCLVDNVKTQRLSWAELESLITSQTISGHQLYAGERTRPNTLTWAITLNGPAMSKDMAQRCAIIKLGDPVHSATWETDTAGIIESRRWEIVADVAAFFERNPAQLAHCSRWGVWEREILARLSDPEDLQALVRQRQEEINADDNEAADVEDYFGQRLAALDYDVEHDWVHLPNEIAVGWFGKAMNDRIGTTAMTRTVNQWASEGMLRRLGINPSRHRGRGLLWRGRIEPTDIGYDLHERLKYREGANENRFWDRY